jgi:2-oxoglutarate dehydrogenase E1 component
MVVPVLIHGDAAFPGQGIVAECFNMMHLDGYTVGGTIHVVVNNQVGFTTNYLDARSSTYCTDVGKVTQALVFHVNADDADAVVQVMRIALAYRQTWHRDVFIDLLGYRRHGHNEGDEPKFTQPTLYKAIAAHPSPRALYLNQLISEGVVDTAYGETLYQEQWQRMEAGYDAACDITTSQVHDFLNHLWQDYRHALPGELVEALETGVPTDRLRTCAERIHALPEGRKYFKKVERLFADRRAMVEADALDWALGELLAYATLLEEGHPVRISGQDVERGTFSHRHAVVKTEDSEEEIVPLNAVADGQARFTAFNSLLSEYAVSGFDYGYAFARPEGLTVWEAQFGDFNNGAQILFDQFLSAAEDKWKTMNGLALFLPHGYEGMGSEHSSGRMERFLQLAAGDNLTVCNVTEPANFFHLLRRQVKWPFRKPLIAFTPKKLLRHPKAVSPLAAFASGGFRAVIDDPRVADSAAVETVVFCSGKVYYDAVERFEQEGIRDCALVRVEQIHPLPEAALEAVVERYASAERYVWLQEEPRNMGAWAYMKLNWTRVNLEPLTRPTSASPAVGSSSLHDRQFRALMEGLTSFSRLKA